MSWDSYTFNQTVELAKKKMYYVFREGTSTHGYHSRAIYNFGLSLDTLEKAKRYAMKESPALSSRESFVIYRYVGKVKSYAGFPSMEALEMLINRKGYILNRGEVYAPVGEIWNNGRYHSYLKNRSLRPRY